jgi:hypothetical protein
VLALQSASTPTKRTRAFIGFLSSGFDANDNDGSAIDAYDARALLCPSTPLLPPGEDRLNYNPNPRSSVSTKSDYLHGGVE